MVKKNYNNNLAFKVNVCLQKIEIANTKAPVTDKVKNANGARSVSWKPYPSTEPVTMSSYKSKFIKVKIEAQRLLLMRCRASQVITFSK